MRVKRPIVVLRKEASLSQAQLAKMLGVSQTAVSQWEISKTFPDIRVAMKLATIFGVTIEDLLAESERIPLQGVAQITNNCRKLNEQGQKKVLEYVEDLIATQKYRNHYSKNQGGKNNA